MEGEGEREGEEIGGKGRERGESGRRREGEEEIGGEGERTVNW